MSLSFSIVYLLFLLLQLINNFWRRHFETIQLISWSCSNFLCLRIVSHWWFLHELVCPVLVMEWWFSNFTVIQSAFYRIYKLLPGGTNGSYFIQWVMIHYHWFFVVIVASDLSSRSPFKLAPVSFHMAQFFLSTSLFSGTIRYFSPIMYLPYFNPEIGYFFKALVPLMWNGM